MPLFCRSRFPKTLSELRVSRCVPRRAKARKRGHRPRLEMLEDRTLPSATGPVDDVGNTLATARAFSLSAADTATRAGSIDFAGDGYACQFVAPRTEAL